MATETLEGGGGVEYLAKEGISVVGDAEKEIEIEEVSGSKKYMETSDRPTRERKKVELYSLSTPLRPTPSKSVSIEKGRGTLLREIPNVAYQLSKKKADDNLILLHTILYGKKAKAQMVKKNIGQFSGFVWSENEEKKQRARVKEKLDKCVKEKLIFFCDVLDIPNRSNTKKEEVAAKVLEFLESPKASRDVLLADREKRAKKRKSAQRKRKSIESSDTPAKRKRQTKKRDHQSDTEEDKGEEEDSDSKGTKDTHDEDDAAPEEGSDHEKTETEDEKEDTEDEKPSDKKNSSKKTKEESSGTNTKSKDKQASAKVSKKSGEKSSKRVAKSTSSPAKKQKVDHDESSKGTSKKQSVKPQANGSKEKGKATKKSKVEPAREEMLEFVSKILKEVDFHTATLSTILKKLSGHFGVDLSHRKPEVKEVIQDAINEMTDEEEEEDEKSEATSDIEKEEEEKAEAECNKEKEEEEEKLND